MKIGALAAGLVLAFSVSGCRVSPPAKLETATMTRIKHSLTVRGKNIHNPLPDSSRTIESGKSAFSNYCVACHGLDGQNTGVPFAETLSPPVPSLASKDVQRYSDGQLKWIVENGVAPSGMPASRGILSDDEMWAIVVYIRHLPPPGSLGEPKVYSGEESDNDQN